MYDLVVCIRCHEQPDFVMDAADSVLWSVSSDTTKLMFAVDQNRKLAQTLKDKLHLPVTCSVKRYGWGAGLYGLLVEAIVFAEKEIGFRHFLSIDYDTLFLQKGADEALLSLIDDPVIGLLGQLTPPNPHWKGVFELQQRILAEMLVKIPSAYIPGEGVSGSCMMLTASGIEGLRRGGFLEAKFRDIVDRGISLADDHLIPIFIRACGLGIKDTRPHTQCTWFAVGDPYGLEETEVKVFHPAKLVPPLRCPQRKDELKVRNYFREKRGRRPIK